MKNTKKVIFVPASAETSKILEFPKPSKNYIPDWYKNMGSNFIDSNGFSKAGPTRCMPFLDSFVSGYTYVLPGDIEFKYNGTKNGRDIVTYQWCSQFHSITTRQEENGAPYSLPNFDGYYNTEFQWYTEWDPKTPKGYSTIYHHPFNRFDLPFQTFAGITDTDHWSGHGPVPFLLKKGFEGIISAGTPIIQFSFIKRENWESDYEIYDENKHPKKWYELKKYLSGGYKKYYWEKKNFK